MVEMADKIVTEIDTQIPAAVAAATERKCPCKSL